MNKTAHINLEGTFINNIQELKPIMENIIFIKDRIKEKKISSFNIFSFAVDENNLQLVDRIISDMEELLEISFIPKEVVPTIEYMMETINKTVFRKKKDAEFIMSLGKEITFERIMLIKKNPGLHVLFDDTIIRDKTIVFPKDGMTLEFVRV